MEDRTRIPVVGGLAFVEAVHRVPSSFRAELRPSRNNPYFRDAIAVIVSGEKVGYLAPEVARRYADPIAAAGDEPLTCPGRHAGRADRLTSGVMLLLDFRQLAVEPLP